MSESEYVPPKKWTWQKDQESKFSNINRPVSGSTHEKTLLVGKHRFQLHSLATPNGMKATIMFEELLESGVREAEYDAWPINILEGDQFGSGFVEINPNSKIPAMIDTERDLRIFESGSILFYLADLFGAFLSKDIKQRTETLSWLFWQVGSAPFLGGGFGHFYEYAPVKLEYPIDRFTMETKRQMDVLDKILANRSFIAGPEYTIADIAIWPWYGLLVQGELYGAGEFLQVQDYKNLKRWADQIAERPAVKRGRRVNLTWGDEKQQLPERHGPEDFNLEG